MSGQTNLDPDADAGDSSIDSEDIPKYLREGLENQSAEDLRGIAAYAEQLADEKEAEAERELEDQTDQETDETPDGWGDDEWSETLDEALGKADIPPSKGTLTTKTIDGKQYIYLQWREGSSVKSQYVAPVSPSKSE